MPAFYTEGANEQGTAQPRSWTNMKLSEYTYAMAWDFFGRCTMKIEVEGLDGILDAGNCLLTRTEITEDTQAYTGIELDRDGVAINAYSSLQMSMMPLTRL